LTDRPDNFIRILTKTTYFGLLLNVVFPIALFVIALLFGGRDPMTDGSVLPSADQAMASMLYYIFLALSVLELGIVFLLRKHLPVFMFKSHSGDDETDFAANAMSVSTMIFAFNEGPAIYGLVLVLLGLDLEVMMLFIAISLIGYQLFRPRATFLDKVLERSRELASANIT
jgi:hypothetical protein